MMYHTMMAAKLHAPSKVKRGMHTKRKVKLTLLSFHLKLLNLSENMGISDTSSHENRQMSGTRQTGM